MTTLKSKLKEDLHTAMKARDELTSSTLRLTLTAITKEEVSGKSARELSDDEVQKVIAKEAKKRREAAEAFAQGGRTEQAEREKAEGELLDGYLPKQLSDDELNAIVASAVEEAKAAGAEGPRAMGAVMKIVNPKVAGLAEGGRVAAAVKKLLMRLREAREAGEAKGWAARSRSTGPPTLLCFTCTGERTGQGPFWPPS